MAHLNTPSKATQLSEIKEESTSQSNLYLPQLLKSYKTTSLKQTLCNKRVSIDYYGESTHLPKTNLLLPKRLPLRKIAGIVAAQKSESCQQTPEKKTRMHTFADPNIPKSPMKMLFVSSARKLAGTKSSSEFFVPRASSQKLKTKKDPMINEERLNVQEDQNNLKLGLSERNQISNFSKFRQKMILKLENPEDRCKMGTEITFRPLKLNEKYDHESCHALTDRPRNPDTPVIERNNEAKIQYTRPRITLLKQEEWSNPPDGPKKSILKISRSCKNLVIKPNPQSGDDSMRIAAENLGSQPKFVRFSKFC